jgi:hypothetical protein
MDSPEDVHRLWRYEVEFKADRARKVLAQLIAPEGKAGFPANICSTVWQWFNERDVPPLFDSHGPTLALDLSAKVTSASQKLAWLSRGVRPTVKRLVSAGYEREVLHSLGIL